jgi:transposase
MNAAQRERFHAQVAAYLRQGNSQQAAARRFGISPSTVSSIAKKQGLPPRRSQITRLETRFAEVAQLAGAGYAISRAARHLGVSIDTLKRFADAHGLVFHRDPRGRPSSVSQDKGRLLILNMVAKRMMTLQEAGEILGISRQRVHQLMHKYIDPDLISQHRSGRLRRAPNPRSPR